MLLQTLNELNKIEEVNINPCTNNSLDRDFRKRKREVTVL